MATILVQLYCKVYDEKIVCAYLCIFSQLSTWLSTIEIYIYSSQVESTTGVTMGVTTGVTTDVRHLVIILITALVNFSEKCGIVKSSKTINFT